ncbi:(Fe-S)-binding protein [Ardenticatena maritima]|nr:(Fe-S)-binding protein [Ardenticatena maritima]KPL86406.1 hypothetical protein SE16_13940 [Ardenticatena maritima]
MQEPVRVTLWNIPTWAAIFMYASQAMGVLALIYGLYRRFRLYFQGKPDPRLNNWPRRLWNFLVGAVGQMRLARQTKPGLMHALMFWSFVVLFLGTVLATIDADIAEHFLHAKLLEGWLYRFYEVTLDIFGLLFFVGLGMAIKRRYIDGSVRLSYEWGWSVFLVSLFLINFTGFIIEGIRLQVMAPAWASWSPVGYVFGAVLGAFNLSETALRHLHLATWMTHSVLVAVFWGILPYTPIAHIFTSPLNTIFTRADDRPQALRPIPNMEEAESWGVGALADFTWTQLLQFDACTECGRCQMACPAWNSGTALNPKHLVMDIRNQMLAEGGMPYSAIGGFANGYTNPTVQPGAALVGEVIRDETLWACTTCRACVYECPVFINHVDAIVDMRRYLVMTEGRMPDTVSTALRNLERTGNPWGYAPSDRMKWAEGLDVPEIEEETEVDYLFWVGCAASYDNRNQKIARATVQLLQKAGVSFAVLGSRESCNGDPARRMGNEYLYQMMAEQTIGTLKKFRFKKIITICPHCFNTMGNEYKDFGGDFEVIHHSQLLADLVKEGRLKPEKPLNETITFHDSCYLGRYNGIFDAPREILASIPGVELREMERSRERGLCCGGGGAGVWMETHNNKRIEQIRLEDALAVNPNTVASACPFCMIMFDSGSKVMGLEDQLALRDVAELLAESVGVNTTKSGEEESEQA